MRSSKLGCSMVLLFYNSCFSQVRLTIVQGIMPLILSWKNPLYVVVCEGNSFLPIRLATIVHKHMDDEHSPSSCYSYRNQRTMVNPSGVKFGHRSTKAFGSRIGTMYYSVIIVLPMLWSPVLNSALQHNLEDTASFVLVAFHYCNLAQLCR